MNSPPKFEWTARFATARCTTVLVPVMAYSKYRPRQHKRPTGPRYWPRSSRTRPRSWRSPRRWGFVQRKLLHWHSTWRQQTPQERTEARIVARFTAEARKLRVRLSQFERELSDTYARDRPPPPPGWDEYSWEQRLGKVRWQLRKNIRLDQQRHLEAMNEVRLAKRGRVHYARYH